MMRHLGLILVLLSFSGISGCGPRPGLKGKLGGEPEGQARGSAALGTGFEPAVELRPVIVRSEERDPSLPSLDSEGIVQDAVAGGSSLIFKEVIPMGVPGRMGTGRERPLFLVWKPESLGSPIVNAYYIYEKRDAFNQKTGTAERKNVFQDKENGRWFIPLAEVVGSVPENVDPTELHWVTLELHREDRSIVNIQVGFRVLGPLPKLMISVLGGGEPPPSPAEFGRRVLHQGWIVAREEYHNPSARKLSLWIRQSGESHVSFNSQLAYMTYRQVGMSHDEAVIEPVSHRYSSETALRFNRVRILRSSMNEDLSMTSLNWQRVDLNPFETIQFEWGVEAFLNPSICQMPVPRELVFEWIITRSDHHGRGEGAPSETVFARSTSRMESWSVASARLVARLHRQVLLADPYATRDEVLALTPARALKIVDEGDGDIDLRRGEYASAPELSCQGFFQ